MKKISLTLIATAITLFAGCNNCEKMVESICKDLGLDDCATWKEIGGPDKAVPGGRGVNKACGMIRDNEIAYEGQVISARGLVLAHRMQKTTDPKQREEIKAALEKNAQASKALGQKLKK